MGELVPITMFLSIAAVLILRPVTKRLGLLLEAVAREKDRRREGRGSDTDARVLTLMEQMVARLDHVEDRLDFTERLMAAPPTDLGRERQRRSATLDVGSR